MIRAIESIMPLDFDVICPGHGPVHTDNLSLAIEMSGKYASDYIQLINGREKRKVLIAYVSAYGYTKEAAEIIASGILETEGIEVDITDIESIPLDELEEKLITSDGILVGSPTINQNTLLPVYKLFALINPLRDRGKLGGSFGSYGWSGESPKIILENFRLLKMRLYEEIGLFKFAPGGSKNEYLKDFGRKFAVKFMENCEQLFSVGKNKTV
jgi:NADH oxidase (H2O-forming)